MSQTRKNHIPNKAACFFRACGCRLFLAMLAMLAAVGAAVPETAHGKGGDRLTGFPVIDLRSGEQYAKAMAVDSAGNMVVVGSVGSVSTDYFVAKFNADGSGLAWLPKTYGGTGTDIATAVAVDSADNIVVTGYVWSGSNYNVHTVKYDGATGDLIWEHTWNNQTINGDDYGVAVTVDQANNIYVAGHSANGAREDDFLVLKYPAGGSTPSWTELSDDASYPNNNNYFTSIAAGIDGIAVTGHSSKGLGDFDIITRKYGFDGTTIRQWRYSSPGSREDRGVAVRMDASGYVAVSGYITNASNNKDIYTAKYHPGSNTPIWERIYNNDGGSGEDEPQALWVDGLGDVYLTGTSATLSGNTDIYTVRYSGSTGSVVWQNVFDAGGGSADVPVGIVVDDAVDGGVFVTGYTTVASTEDFLTMKYRKDSGAVLWSTTWNNAFNLNDRPVGIALSSRNVVVAGWTGGGASGNDFIAMKYDFGPLNAPTKLMASPASNTSITLSWADNAINENKFIIQRKLGITGPWSSLDSPPAGFVVTSPAPPNGMGTITFTDTGLTTNQYYYYRVLACIGSGIDNCSHFSNEAHALTKVVSYDNPTWTFLYNGADNLEDIPSAITFGTDNHPVVTGYSDLTEEGLEPGPDTHTFDYMTFKLDRTTGSIKWKALFDSGDGGTDMAAGVVLDSAGDLIVTGTAYLPSGGDKSDELYTRKVRTSTVTDPTVEPDFMWDDQFGTAGLIDYATAISMVKDGSNNSVVLGYGQNMDMPPDHDIFVLKLNSSGVRAWTPVVYDSGRHDEPAGLVIDASGDIFVTGWSFDKTVPAGSYDWFTAKYSGATGALIWSDTFNISSEIYGRAGGNDQALGIDVDPAGNAYVTGYATNAAGNWVLYTVKYDGAATPAGNRRIWQKAFNYTTAEAGFDAEGAAVKVDPIDGAVVVAGTAYVNDTDSDIHLVRYNPADGSLTEGGTKPFWQINFDSPGRYEYVTAMTIDSSGYIYVTGNTRSGPDTDPLADPSSDIMSLIFNYEGTFLGAMRYDGTGKKDEATAITANYAGEAFIAGPMTNGAGNPDYAVLKQVNNYLLVPAPFTVTNNADSSKANLSWQHNNPNATFVIRRTEGPVTQYSDWITVATTAAGSTSYTDTTLTANTNYCYGISALYNTLPSREVVRCVITRVATPILEPLVLGPDPLAPTITLSWNNVSNNTGYKIERKIGTGSWADLTPKGADITTHTDTGLSQGTTYTYRVTALGPAGNSMASNERTALTKPAAPTLGTPTGITNYQMTLAWNSTDASSYTLEMKPSGGVYGPAGAGCTGTSLTSCTVTGLTSLTQYFFRVKATNASGDSTWSNETSATAILAVPTLNAPATVTKNSMSLSWTAVSGAGVTSYPLQFKEGTSGEWIDSGCPVGTATSCTVSLPKPDTLYYFQVKARNSYGDSAWSNSTSAKTLLPEPQLLSVTGISTTTIDLVWSDNSLTENNYVVERSACSTPNTTSATCATGSGYSATWTNVSNNLPANTTSWSNSTAVAGTFYRYRVKATTTAGNSSIYSNELYASTRLAQPVMSSIVPVSTTSLTISWGDITGETSYTLERKQGSSGTYAPVTSLAMNTVTFTDSALNTETEYCYRVMASTSFGVPSVYSSNELCKTTPLSAPVQALPVISQTAAQIDLSWSQTLYNTGYEVERCVTTDNNQPVTHPLGTCTNLTPKLLQDVNFLSNTVTAGNTYRYRVRAYYNNSTEYTSWSNEYWATAKPPKPTLNTPTVASASQLNLGWNNVLGDIGYNIYWKVRSGGTCSDDNWNGPLVTAINATSYAHGSLSPNTYYCYKINAKGPTGPPATPDSDFSSIVSQTTLPAATTLNAPTDITASNVCLSWSNVMPNTGYKIERKTGVSGAWGTVGGDLPADNVNATVNWCNNSGLASGTLYYYRVSVKNAAGYSAVSNERFATTTPAVPVITATVISDDRIDICWPLVFGATYYKLDRKIGSDGEYVPHANPSPPYSTSYCGEPSPTIGCPTATPNTYCYQDTSLTADTTYYYHVHAGNGTDSVESAERTATTLGFAGRNLTATALAGGLTIRLNWTPVACSPDPCDDPDYFEIQRQVRDGMWMQLKIVEGTATSYMDNVAIDPNGKYRYRIRSLKGTLQSPYAEAEAFAKTYLTGTNVCR